MRITRPPKQGQELVSRNGAISKWACPKHKIEYYGPSSSKPECAVCRADEVTEDLRQALQEANNRVSTMERELDTLRAKTEASYAMGSCVDLLDDEDRLFLKSVLYRWRHDKGIGLRVTHWPAKRAKDKPEAKGFIAMPRNGEPFGHDCSSIGGVAIAGYFEEAQRALGDAQAMGMLARAANILLQGGIGS